MADFPASLIPHVTTGYSHGGYQNGFISDIPSGVSMPSQDYRNGLVLINIGIRLNTLFKRQLWADFLYAKIDGGASKFNMMIDTGNGYAGHVCQMDQTTYQMNGTNDPAWQVSFTVEAEVIG